uniref:Glycosyl hydrolase n=1 Tax=Tetraselmis sp. GSL018 TaxID=582737 RepID=A0A061QWG1_9CHLO
MSKLVTHRSGGAERFSVVCENPFTHHWEGSLASPCIVADPGNASVLISSNDRCEKPATQIHGSKDGGQSWAQLAELDSQFWSTLFYHRGNLYVFGTTQQYGDVVIRRSTDGGHTWTEPLGPRSAPLFSASFWPATTLVAIVVPTAGRADSPPVSDGTVPPPLLWSTKDGCGGLLRPFPWAAGL